MRCKVFMFYWLFKAFLFFLGHQCNSEMLQLWSETRVSYILTSSNWFFNLSFKPIQRCGHLFSNFTCQVLVSVSCYLLWLKKKWISLLFVCLFCIVYVTEVAANSHSWPLWVNIVSPAVFFPSEEPSLRSQGSVQPSYTKIEFLLSN